MSNLFYIFDKIAEQRIHEVIEHGEFDDLPGKGKLFNLEDDSHLPPDFRPLIPYFPPSLSDLCGSSI